MPLTESRELCERGTAAFNKRTISIVFSAYCAINDTRASQIAEDVTLIYGPSAIVKNYHLLSTYYVIWDTIQFLAWFWKKTPVATFMDEELAGASGLNCARQYLKKGLNFSILYVTDEIGQDLFLGDEILPIVGGRIDRG